MFYLKLTLLKFLKISTLKSKMDLKAALSQFSF